MPDDLVSSIISYADENDFPEAPASLGLNGLAMFRTRNPSPLQSILYIPTLCLVLQGRKEMRYADQSVVFGARETLIVSVDLPAVSQILDASDDKPYVALALAIDFSLLRNIQIEMDQHTPLGEACGPAVSGSGSTGLRHAMARLFYLVDRSEAERNVLAPLIIKEVHYWMLMEGHGNMLRSLSQADSHASRISKAIRKLRQDYASQFSIDDLATLVGMSNSSFHEHFKAFTGTTPLQYQKEIRLLLAQQKLINDKTSVARVAFEIGYESPSQFSREYTRKFGHPPSEARRSSDSSNLGASPLSRPGADDRRAASYPF